MSMNSNGAEPEGTFPCPLPRRVPITGQTPGPRCGHTLTAIAGPTGDFTQAKLILFGGATALEGGQKEPPPSPGTSGGSQLGSGAGIRLAGATHDVHVFDIRTGEAGAKWEKIVPDGEPPSARAAHAAAAVGNMVVIQGGIGPHGLADNDLHVLDFSNMLRPKWHRVVVQGQCPGPRYAHTLCLVGNRFLVIVGGNDGRQTLSDAWALDTSEKPYQWQRIQDTSSGIAPPGRMYAAAAPRNDGLMLLCGGRDVQGTPLGDAYGLARHRDGRWEWAPAPLPMPAARYQHGAVFVARRLFVMGGAMGGGKMVDETNSALIFDTTAGIWAGHNGEAALVDLARRCRHAIASVGPLVFMYGGLRQSQLLDDFLIADDSGGHDPLVRELCRHNFAWREFFDSARPGAALLAKQMQEEAAAVLTRHPEPARSSPSPGRASSGSKGGKSPKSPDSPFAIMSRKPGESPSPTPDMIKLHGRVVLMPMEEPGDMRAIVRQLSIDMLENEGKRVGDGARVPGHEPGGVNKTPGSGPLHKYVIDQLLKPHEWLPPEDRSFILDVNQIYELCDAAEDIFRNEPTVLRLGAPIKIFGDLHGQFGDLMRLFREYGTPCIEGDITYIDYLFLGDYVDRGRHSLETICLLLALKVEFPRYVHLIRGNHEDLDINSLFGFREECRERLGHEPGLRAWKRINDLFNVLPLAATVADRILCMHGGIGQSINQISEIESIERPIRANQDEGGQVMMDLLWSDPTPADSIEGVHVSPRGQGLVMFGPDRVVEFCRANNLQMIIRAHECVMDGFERFAGGKLITLFSATNYCGTANNAGAILVLGRDLTMVPKLIHPLPPEPESPSGYLYGEAPQSRFGGGDVWMQDNIEQRPPTPVRGRGGNFYSQFQDYFAPD